jgi:FixJ family two-component response regulator
MSDAKPIVFVVDDDVSVQESIGLLVESMEMRPETFGSGQEFLLRPQTVTPSCLVLDVFLPDLNGCDLQTLLVDRPDMPIIFISGYGDVPTTVRAMKAGAVEFFIKPFADDAITGAIRNAIDRSRAALADGAEMRALRDSYASLSLRERQVMVLVVAGRLNKQVGGELGISEITVKAHRGSVMRKMKAGSLCDLVRMASGLGFETLCDGLMAESRLAANRVPHASHRAHHLVDWTKVFPAVWSRSGSSGVPRRSNIDPPCRSNTDPGMDAGRRTAGYGQV